jgi:hypothetical protein
MVISKNQLAEYLEANQEETWYTLPDDTEYIFKICTPTKNPDLFKYRMEFFSPDWGRSTRRQIATAPIEKFLNLFNEDNIRPIGDYRNEVNPKPNPSPSASARYFVHLLTCCAADLK